VAKVNLKADKLNLGCGNEFMEGWENIDLWEYDPRVIPIDLEKASLPYKTSSIAEVRAHHVLEHVFNYIELLNECHRVIVPKGFIDIHVPKFPHPSSVKDPTHVRFFNEETFKYFSEYLDLGCFSMYRIKPWDLHDIRFEESEIQAVMKPIK